VSAFPFNMFSPFSEAIGKFLYDPVTNWQGAFSPSIVFNANPQDAPIEANVLSKVGSYGKQLGILIRVVDILQEQMTTQNRGKLDEAQVAAVAAFKTLRDDATDAANAFRAQVSADDILDLAKAFRAHKSAAESTALRQQLDEALGE
jgi:hypothetical protein